MLIIPPLSSFFYADIVELLLSDGKQIAAVHFIQAFQLNDEKFAPVPLLKTYLRDLRKTIQGRVGGLPVVQKVAFMAILGLVYK